MQYKVEVCSDFPDHKLPTPDFPAVARMVGLSHSFFQKSMRTSFLIIQRNAMSNQQKYSILVNDLVRRLSNINKSAKKRSPG